MLIDTENKFVTGRDEPTLVLLHVEYKEEEKCLEVTSRNPQVRIRRMPHIHTVPDLTAAVSRCYPIHLPYQMPMEPLRLSLEPQPVEWSSPELVTVR